MAHTNELGLVLKPGDRIAVCGVTPKGRWFAVPEATVKQVRFFTKGEEVMGDRAPATGYYCELLLPRGRDVFIETKWLRKLDADDLAYKDVVSDYLPGKKV